ncbi:hypothetical protein AA13595_1290 [Gluconacetobacter johannae DSM 13595]|nr:hypothetical protein AA13595_1290 [Gluconacetobacter johannae DSM 13595]
MRHSPTTLSRRFFALQPERVRALRGFVDETGWRVIWGLNFGTGTPEQAAEEAAAVHAILGPALLAFQIGNEPDLFNRYGHAMRGADWSSSRYVDEWTSFARSVLTVCPQARFWGPDTAINDDWITRFALEAPKRLGAHITGLSGHYYAEGPPDAPESTIEHLLAGDPRVERRLADLQAVLPATGLPFVMTEGNSCYLGGKPGVSDSFASALWGADYVARMASGGCDGVCFHGGAAEVEHANGENSQGAHTAAEHVRAKSGAFYSPIAGTPETGYTARPLYYGLQAAASLANTSLLPCALETGGANLTAYAGRHDAEITLLLVNRDLQNDVRLDIACSGGPRRIMSDRQLIASSVHALNGVHFRDMPALAGQAPSGLAVPRASILLLTLR